MAFRYCLPERGVASLKRCGDTLDTVRLKWSCYKHSGRLQICFVLLRRCNGVHAGRVLLSLALGTLCTFQGTPHSFYTAAFGVVARSSVCCVCLAWYSYILADGTGESQAIFLQFFEVRHLAQCGRVYTVQSATLDTENRETAVKASGGLCKAFYRLGGVNIRGRGGKRRVGASMGLQRHFCACGHLHTRTQGAYVGTQARGRMRAHVARVRACIRMCAGMYARVRARMASGESVKVCIL